MQQTVSATEFKAKCLDLLDQVDGGDRDELEFTRRERAVARLLPPQPATVEGWAWHGFMRGAGAIPEGFDFTEPTSGEV